METPKFKPFDNGDQIPAFRPLKDIVASTGEMQIQEPLEPLIPVTSADVGATGGAVTGAIAGSAFGPVGTVVGGIGGALIGGTVGEGIKLALANLYNLPDAPKDYAELMKLAIREGSIQAVWEIAGFGMGAVVQKIVRPFGKLFEKQGVKSLVDFGKRYDIALTPGQQLDHHVLDLVESVAENSLFGGQALKGHKVEMQELVNEVAETIKTARKGGHLEAEDIGDAFLDSFSEQKEISRRIADSYYAQVDKFTKDAVVDLRGLKKLGKELEDKAKIRIFGRSENGDLLVANTKKLKDVVTFKEAQSIRSGIMADSRAMAETKDKARWIAGELEREVEKAIETSAKLLDGEALASYKTANAFWKNFKNDFSNKFMRTLAKKDPEAIGKSLIGGGKITGLRRVKNVVDNETFELIVTGYLNDSVQASFSTGGDFIGNTWIKRLDGIGQKTRDLLWDRRTQEELYNMGKLAQRIQDKSKSGGGGMLIQLTQAGIIVSAMAGAIPAGAGYVMLLPAGVSHLFKSKFGRKWLTEGFKINPNTKHAAAAMGRLLRHFDEAGKQDMLVVVDNPLTDEPQDKQLVNVR